MLPSLEGRRFSAVERAEAGEVDPATVFEYHERDGLVWARYEGGAIRLGFLVGAREGDQLAFRYCHINSSGETAAGRCRTRISIDADGSVILAETWNWESKQGEGTSLLREVPAGAVRRR